LTATQRHGYNITIVVPPTSLRTGFRSPPSTPLVRGRVPLHRQLRDALRADIASGRLAVGDTLPTEQVLAATFGVSRITIRHALSELERDGLVRRRRPTGNIVASNRPQPASAWSFESLQDIVAFGEQTQVQILSFASHRAPADVAQVFGVRRGATLPCVHGLRFLRSTPLSEFRFWIAPNVACELTQQDLQQPTLFSVIENRLGITLVRAEQTVWCEVAGRDVARKLRMRASAPVLAIRRVYVAEGGAPVEIAISRFEGSRYRLHHVLHRVAPPRHDGEQ